MYHIDDDNWPRSVKLPLPYVPFRYRFCNYLLRTPFVGILFPLFYILCCLPEGTPVGCHITIGIVLGIISIYSTIPVTFVTPIAFVVSLFFVSDLPRIWNDVFAYVTLAAIPIFVCHYIVIRRLITGQYETSPTTGAILVNPEWLARYFFENGFFHRN